MDIKSIKNKLINWIKDYFKENDRSVAVIGISGGKDSTICAALLKEAIGADRIIAVMMPNGEQKDIKDSYSVCDYLNIPKQHRFEVNINSSFKDLKAKVARQYSYSSHIFPLSNIVWSNNFNESMVENNDNINTNLPARLRMCVLYTIAALYPGARVCNTSNLSERYVGYSTKWGDGVGDFAPIANLTVREVLAIGDDLNLPEWMVHKTPSDGMSGKSDEEKLGFSYEELDAFLLEGVSLPADKEAKIKYLHEINQHKLNPIPSFHLYDNQLGR